jgi:hypothetical protein
VQGVLGVQGFIVTPHGSGMIGQLIEGMNHEVRRPGSWISFPGLLVLTVIVIF